eukprot:405831-Prymnesium_polylepis.1
MVRSATAAAALVGMLAVVAGSDASMPSPGTDSEDVLAQERLAAAAAAAVELQAKAESAVEGTSLAAHKARAMEHT